MKLLYEMFGINEAGVENEPTAEPKKKRKSFAADRDEEDPEDAGDEVPEFGTSDLPDEEPPPEFGSSEPDLPEPEEDEPAPDDDLDPRNDKKFASEPQKSKPKAVDAAPGLTISGDTATLNQLRDALEQLANSPKVDDDLADWLDECVRAIDMAGRRHEPNVSLPRFTATPDLDDFDDADDASDDDY